MKPKTKYYAEGWGKNWWVMSRNRRSVAQCTNKAMATKIAKLLSEDAERKAEWLTPDEIQDMTLDEYIKKTRS